MNAQDMVLERFPNAVARQAPAILERGLPSFGGGFWAIFAGPDPDADELGWGKSETEAWLDAAGQRGNQAA
jgi:hypothetical protein